MLLEGSTIDSAGHENDVVGAMSEMEDFEKAVHAALQFAKRIKKPSSSSQQIMRLEDFPLAQMV